MSSIDESIHRLCQGSAEQLSKDELAGLTITISASGGLSRKNLARLVDLVTHPSRIPAAACVRIIRDLLPLEPVGNNVVLRILSCLSEGNKIPLQSKTKLLRWLVIVYDQLEDKTIITKLYGVLFGQLKYESSRQWVCHLLFLSTNPSLVRPWRVAYLRELYDKNRESPHLLALLKLYKDCAPELVPESYPPVRGTIFRHPDPTKTLSSNYKLTSLSKRQKLAVPQIQSRTIIDANNKLGIEDVQTLKELVNNIDSLKLPLQIGSALGGNPMLAKLLRYSPEESEGWSRLDVFLKNALNDAKGKSSINQLFRLISWLTEQTLRVPSAASNHILHHIESWNDSQITIAVIYICSRMDSTSKLNKILKNILERNKQIALDFISMAPSKHCQLIDSYAIKHVDEVAIQDAVLRFHETENIPMPPDLTLQYLQTQVPMTISRTCGLSANSTDKNIIDRVQKILRDLPSTSLFYKANVETINTLQKDRFTLGAESRHGTNEPVTPESLRRVKSAGGIDITYDQYREKLINTLTSKGYSGFQQAHLRLDR